MRTRPFFAFAVTPLLLAAVATGCSSGDEMVNPAPSPESDASADSATSDATTTATHDASTTDARGDDGGEDASDATTHPNEDGGDDGGDRDAGPDGSTTPDGSVDADTDSASPDASDGGVLDGSNGGSLDAGDGAAPDASDGGSGATGPCDATPIYATDAGSPLPARVWCDSFAYPAYTEGAAHTLVEVHPGFAPDGGVTLVGAVGEDALTYGITVAGTVLPGGGPFAISLDSTGTPVSALALSAGTIGDAGASVSMLAGTVGTGGDLALGGTASPGESYPLDGAFWTYTSSGALEAMNVFALPSGTGYSVAEVSAIAPVAGGDFIVAGTFGNGAVVGGTALAAPDNYDTFVARFAPGGQARWVSTLGEGSPNDDDIVRAVVDADGHVSVALTRSLDDAGYETLAARFDPTTGAEQWVTPLTGLSWTNTLVADGDDLVITVANGTGYQVIGLHGADGSVRYQGPATGQGGDYSTVINGAVSDGAGGTVMVGTTSGGTFGSITLPASQIEQCFVAGADATGNLTWLTLCSPLLNAEGLGIAVSGKTIVLTGAGGLTNVGGTPLITFAEEYLLP